MIALEFRGAGLVHGTGKVRTVALAPTDLVVHDGDTIGVIGRSGAGKSTLAELALGLRSPSFGTVLVAGEPWSAPGRTPPLTRRGLVQGVPQDAQATLPPRWSVGTSLRTTARRLAATGASPPSRSFGLRHRRAAEAAVDRAVEMAIEVAQCDPDLLGRRPHQLSGGQAQRVAIARALVARPTIIVADEPTSALDSATSERVAETLFDLAERTGIAVVVVTHDESLAGRCRRIVQVSGGRIDELAH